jgi:hypothetical protein
MVRPCLPVRIYACHISEIILRIVMESRTGGNQTNKLRESLILIRIFPIYEHQIEN